MNKDIKVVLLVGSGNSSRIVYNYLKNKFNIVKVIQEKPTPKSNIIKRRIKRLGYFKVFGQVLFLQLVVKLLKLTSKKRINEICESYGFELSPISGNVQIEVNTINDDETKKVLLESNADIVVVNGTGIIKKNVFQVIEKPFINTHVGITPLYRGVHGGYWALVNMDADNCGVTVHHIDAGIDTGGIIAQEIIKPTGKDNFVTYPLLQLGEALSRLEETILNHRNIQTIANPAGKSKLWYHPTIFEYVRNRLLFGVK